MWHYVVVKVPAELRVLITDGVLRLKVRDKFRMMLPDAGDVSASGADELCVILPNAFEMVLNLRAGLRVISLVRVVPKVRVSEVWAKLPLVLSAGDTVNEEGCIWCCLVAGCADV